jgi:hypothetical protein
VIAIARLMDNIGSQGPQIVDSHLDEFAFLRPIISFMGRNHSGQQIQKSLIFINECRTNASTSARQFVQEKFQNLVQSESLTRIIPEFGDKRSLLCYKHVD